MCLIQSVHPFTRWAAYSSHALEADMMKSDMIAKRGRRNKNNWISFKIRLGDEESVRVQDLMALVDVGLRVQKQLSSS